VSAALAAGFVLTPVAAGYAPAWSQDFSITNPEEPVAPAHRDLMRQLQAWWDVHAYYPKHASNNDEGGTVKMHLRILADGRIWMHNVAQSSGSRSIDAAALSVFNGGFVRPFPEGTPEANIDISLHYVLAHRHDQPIEASYTPVPSKSPFTITNDPVKSPILDTMLKRTCTGTIVRGGIRNHPAYGNSSWAQAIFFRKPDGTPWVKTYEYGYPSLSPVTEVGKMVQWTGREEHLGKGASVWMTYTVWPEGDNRLVGNLGTIASGSAFGGTSEFNINLGGTVDLTCETEVLPTVAYNDWFAQTMLHPPGDPP